MSFWKGYAEQSRRLRTAAAELQQRLQQKQQLATGVLLERVMREWQGLALQRQQRRQAAQQQLQRQLLLRHQQQMRKFLTYWKVAAKHRAAARQ